MADVFISYRVDDKALVEPLVKALRAEDITVWWSQEIPAMAPWELTIEKELAGARVAIVAWTKSSVTSENVKSEAREARRIGKLIQAFMDECEPPLFFGERQGVILIGWHGDRNHHQFKLLVDAIRAIKAGKKPPHGVGYAPKKGTPWAPIAALLGILSASLALIANFANAEKTVCSLGPLNPYCVQYGLIPPPVDPEAEKAKLIKSLDGSWSRNERDCSEAVTISTDKGDGAVWRVTVRAPGFESVSEVVHAENGDIETRELTPQPGQGRKQTNWRPNGRQLVSLDEQGVSTTLGRCEVKK